MTNRFLVHLWGFTLSVLAVFTIAGYLFGAKVVDNVQLATRTEQQQLAERIVNNVGSYVARVQRTMETILENEAENLETLNEEISHHLRMLMNVYPEVGNPLYVQNNGEIHAVGDNGFFIPMGLALEDIFEGAELRTRLFDTKVNRKAHVVLTDFTRFDTATDRVELLPVLLFYKQVRSSEGIEGALVVPYQLDFLVDRFVGALKRGDDTMLALVSDDGGAVYSTLKSLTYTDAFPSLGEELLPWSHSHFYPIAPRSLDRARTTLGQKRAIYGAFDLPLPDEDEPVRHLGWLAPLRIANVNWTVIVTSPEKSVLQTHWGIILPLMMGAVFLAGLIIGFAFFSFRRIQRHMEQSDQFRAAMEQSGTGLLVSDKQFRFLYANRAFYETTGTQSETIVGSQTTDYLQRIENPAQISQARQQLQEGNSWQGVVRVHNEEGTETQEFSASSAPIIHQGRMIGYITSISDITHEVQSKNELERYANELARAKRELERDIDARKLAEREKAALERQLRRSQTLEAVGQLAGGVAHDFNNVLGSILACLYAIERSANDEAALTEELGRTKELCKRGGELTRQLLAVGRRTVSHEGLIDMGQFLSSIGLLLERTLSRNIKLTVEAEPNLPLVKCDRSNLLTAFLNLGLNARDAMPSGGMLTIEARRDPAFGASGGIAVEVSDTGSGIPEMIQDRIFEPFFTTKRPGAGTGLGLSTAYVAITESEGDITVSSTPGSGATFTVRLAAAAESALPADEARQRMGGQHPFTSGYILVVEDEEGIARMIHETLHAHDYRTLSATTGLEALEAVRDHRERIGAVTLDFVLPEHSGADVYRYLRDFVPEIPVLAITGRADLIEELAHVPPLLPKPFTDDDLLDALAALLRADDELDANPAPALTPEA